MHFGGIRKPRLGNSDLLVMAHSKNWTVDTSGGNGGTRNLNYTVADLREWWGAFVLPPSRCKFFCRLSGGGGGQCMHRLNDPLGNRILRSIMQLIQTLAGSSYAFRRSNRTPRGCFLLITLLLCILPHYCRYPLNQLEA
jgi:hypothetical protein